MERKSIHYLLTGIALVSSSSFFSSNPAEAHSFDYCIDLLQDAAEISVTGISRLNLEQRNPEDYQAFSKDCEQDLREQGFITLSQVRRDRELAESVRNGILVLDSLDPATQQQQQQDLLESEESLRQSRRDICAQNNPSTDFACRPQRQRQLEELLKIENLQSATPRASSVLVAAAPQASDILNQWTSKILKPMSPLVSLIRGNWGDRTHDTSSSPASADLVAQAGPSSPDGEWEDPFEWPLVPVHMAVLPNRKVLAWTRPKLSEKPNTPQYTVWNPALGKGINAFTNAPAFGEPKALSTDIFCTGHDFAPSGNLLVVGGHEGEPVFEDPDQPADAGDGSRDINVYNFKTNGWISYNDKMKQGRWYPTVTYNGNGEGVIVGGSIANEDNSLNQIPEVWGTGGKNETRPLSKASSASFKHTNTNSKGTTTYFGLPVKPYLWNFLAPSGRILNVGPLKATRVLDTNAPGRWLNPPLAQTGMDDRYYGTAVMYDKGKVIIIGGSQEFTSPPTNTSEIIDLFQKPSPIWMMTKGDMQFPRRHHTATLLADGKVFVAGGTRLGDFNNQNGRVREGEIWDPETGLWDTVASMDVTRAYHTTAVLLPDATVLVGGGGLPNVLGNKPDSKDRYQGNYNAEIYRPPLFKGARPKILSVAKVGFNSSVLANVSYGQTFPITHDSANISKVHLIRLSSMTHQFNMGQRISRLNFTSNPGVPGVLSVTAPSSSDKNLTPPGHYMLFILNNQGVPSEAQIVRIS